MPNEPALGAGTSTASGLAHRAERALHHDKLVEHRGDRLVHDRVGHEGAVVADELSDERVVNCSRPST
jgi:hypothetical protein